jgi:hypothetical protein
MAAYYGIPIRLLWNGQKENHGPNHDSNQPSVFST